MSQETELLDDVVDCVDAILQRVGARVVLALPLGIGKPNHIANELVRRAMANPAIDLTIVTALSLATPTASSALEQRLLQPIVERVFGAYPPLEYQRLARSRQLPKNIQVIEFFLEPGKWLNNTDVQTHYLAANYTHVARELMARGVNVIAQLVARRVVGGTTEYSLGSNPDVTLDLLPYVAARRAHNQPIVVVGAVHEEMPFMLGTAALPAAQFDLVLADQRYNYPLFAPPNAELSLVDHAIGLHASSLVRDGGTLQIGIGELGDALCYALLLRHQQNAAYRQALHAVGSEHSAPLIDAEGGRGAFEIGLFGSTEMFVDQMLDLYRAGVLRRRVYDWLPLQHAVARRGSSERLNGSILDDLIAAGLNPLLSASDFERLRHFGVLRSDTQYLAGRIRVADGDWLTADLADHSLRERLHSEFLGGELRHGTLLHAGFLLGPRGFYAALRGLPEAERALFDMRSVGYINQLYGDDYALRVAQRADARHINTTMMVTILGAAVSDSLADGRVVSGVGGQYNFVAMAHALPGARSILCVRATRDKDGVLRSNIVSDYGSSTIPRHLRDIVITEYGIADLRGRTDGECAAALIGIADSRFQSELVRAAQQTGKLSADFQIPEHRRDNTPQGLARAFRGQRAAGLFSDFPFGTDLTTEEIRLSTALRWLARHARTPGQKARTLASALLHRSNTAYNCELARLQLASPRTLRERVMARLVLYALNVTA